MSTEELISYLIILTSMAASFGFIYLNLKENW